MSLMSPLSSVYWLSCSPASVRHCWLRPTRSNTLHGPVYIIARKGESAARLRTCRRSPINTGDAYTVWGSSY